MMKGSFLDSLDNLRCKMPGWGFEILPLKLILVLQFVTSKLDLSCMYVYTVVEELTARGASTCLQTGGPTKVRLESSDIH